MFPRGLPFLQMPTAYGLRCHWASRDARVWMGQRRAQQGHNPRAKDSFIEVPDTTEVEDRLKALEREEKRRQVAIKFQRLRKQLAPPGTIERRLSCDAMEQIRYLKQEFPEEWTVARLVEGFSVSTDVIHRVLRSKFLPSPERRAKQDSKVRQRSLPASTRPGEDPHQLPESHNAVLPAGTGSTLTAGTGSTLTAFHPQSLATETTAPSGGGDSPGSLTLPTPHSPVWSSTTPQELQTELPSFLTQEEDEEGEEQDSWNGRVLSDTELEELVGTHPEQNYQVVQKGSEFFDSAGNFLYRI